MELVTKQDFVSFENRMITEMSKLLQSRPQEKEWLKTSDVLEILGCSPGTLQNLRINGLLASPKLMGTHYYKKSDVYTLLESNYSKKGEA